MTGHIDGFEGINPNTDHGQMKPSEGVQSILNTPPKKIAEKAIAAGAILGAVVIGSGAAFLVSPTWMTIGALLGAGILIGGGLAATVLLSAKLGQMLNKAAKGKMACKIANSITDKFKKAAFSKDNESGLRNEFKKGQSKATINQQNTIQRPLSDPLANSKFKPFIEYLLQNKTKDALDRDLSKYLNADEKKIILNLYNQLDSSLNSDEINEIKPFFGNVSEGYLAEVYKNNEEFQKNVELRWNENNERLETRHATILNEVIPKLSENKEAAFEANKMFKLMQLRKGTKENIEQLLGIASTLKKNGRAKEANERILGPIDRRLNKIWYNKTLLIDEQKIPLLTENECKTINKHHQNILKKQ